MGTRNVRYPEFPSLPNYLLADKVGMKEAWSDIGHWASSFIRVLEEDVDSQNIMNVAVDKNKSINISGRIKVADIDATVTAQSGDIRYNSSTNKHQGYNGSSWNDMY